MGPTALLRGTAGGHEQGMGLNMISTCLVSTGRCEPKSASLEERTTAETEPENEIG